MTHPATLGDPIASRELIRDGSTVLVLIWQPFKEKDEVWVCPFQIKGFGADAVQYAHGSDGIQALQQSFAGVRAHLNSKQNRIYWIGPDIPDAGFARTIDWGFGTDMYEYLCDLMDREVLPFPDDYQRSKAHRAGRISEWKLQRDSDAGEAK